MRIAVPMHDGKLSAHFGHCQQFMVIDADSETNTITEAQNLIPPAHEPGVLPQWLKGLCVELVIAGGMGQRAQQLFEQSNIKTIVGAPALEPKQLVTEYLKGSLECGQNVCDH